MGTNIKLIFILVITAIISSSAFFFFPVAKEAGAEPALALAFASTLTQLTALAYVLSSLKIIKHDLRIAYYLLALGVLLFSFIQLFPSLTVIPEFGQLYADELVANLLFLIPCGLGSLLMYLGILKFAGLVRLPNLRISFLLTSCAALLFVALFVSLPVAEEGLNPTAKAVLALSSVFSLAALLLAVRIRKSIGALYKGSISWTAAALGAVTFTMLHELIVKTYFLSSDYAVNSLSLWPFLATGLLLLKAGASFRDTGRDTLHLPRGASFISVVVGASSLVSNPVDIEKELDKLRVITSRKSEAELSSAEKDTLVQLYLYIEKYLTTKDALYKYTQEGLRANLPSDFLQKLSKV